MMPPAGVVVEHRGVREAVTYINSVISHVSNDFEVDEDGNRTETVWTYSGESLLVDMYNQFIDLRRIPQVEELADFIYSKSALLQSLEHHERIVSNTGMTVPMLPESNQYDAIFWFSQFFLNTFNPRMPILDVFRRHGLRLTDVLLHGNHSIACSLKRI